MADNSKEALEDEDFKVPCDEIVNAGSARLDIRYKDVIVLLCVCVCVAREGEKEETAKSFEIVAMLFARETANIPYLRSLWIFYEES